MIFTVTYREKNGALAEVEIEALGRAECFAQCRARGITPMKVREGVGARRAQGSQGARNQETKTPRTPKTPRRPGKPGNQDNQGAKARSNLLGVLGVLGVLAILALVVAWWWLAGARDARPYRAKPPATDRPKAADQPDARPSRPRVALPVVATNAPLRTAIATNPPPSNAGDPYGGKWRGQKIVSYSVKTNGWSTYEHIVTADGKKHGVIGSSVKPIFDNGSDQMLAMAVRASRDSETPPMPLSPLLESDFLESLKKPIVIKEDDSEEVKQLKRDVMQAREDMMNMMNKGMTVQQALEEHFKIANENVGIRNKAVAELRSIIESGDEEGAAKYMEAVNATLEKMGIMKLELPEPRVRGRSKEATGQKQF